MTSLQRAAQNRTDRMIVVHRKSETQISTPAIAKRVGALDVDGFVEEPIRAK